MNIRDLQYLVAVADHKHFGKASKASFVSQPTLSMQVKKLEETLGIQIFERNNKKVSITLAGEEIITTARKILQEIDFMKEQAKTSQDPFAGKLRIGAFPTIAPYLLPKIVPLIHKEYPNLQLLLLEEKTDQLINSLNEGKIDAAILALPIDDLNLEKHELFEDPFFLAMPANHRLADKHMASLGDLRDESVLLLEEGHCLRSQALEVCDMVGTRENEEFRATSMETLRQMVAAGVGITLIPKLAHQDDDGIRYLPFGEPKPSRTIGIVWRKKTARRESLEAIKRLIAGEML